MSPRRDIFLIRGLNYFTCPPTTTFNGTAMSHYQQRWLKQNKHLKLPEVVAPIFSCQPKCWRVSYRTDTLCHRRGQEASSLNKLYLFPPPCVLHISSFHPQTCRCLNSLFTDMQQFICSPLRPNTSENQRRKKPRGGEGEDGGIRRRRYLITQQATGLLSHSEVNLCSTAAI